MIIDALRRVISFAIITRRGMRRAHITKIQVSLCPVRIYSLQSHTSIFREAASTCRTSTKLRCVRFTPFQIVSTSQLSQTYCINKPNTSKSICHFISLDGANLER